MSPHRSFIINMRYAVRISSNSVTMSDGLIVPIARGEYMTVKKWFIEYTFNAERES